MDQHIIIHPFTQETKEFLDLPDGPYKNLQYINKMRGVSLVEGSLLIKDDGVIHYSYINYKLQPNKTGGYYKKATEKHGFTLNEKGKLKIWFGENPGSIPLLDKVLTALKIDWLKGGLMHFLTKGVLEKVLTGKVTNPTDFAKAYLKANRIKASHSLFLKAVDAGMIKSKLFKDIAIAKNIDHYLEWYINDTTSSIEGLNDRDRLNLREMRQVYHDMIQQAFILNRKINFMWSDRRVVEEHDQWTKEIMDLEAENLSTEDIEWLNPFKQYQPEGFKLITTQKDLYAEGKLMSHCVYTNYYTNVITQGYLVYHVTLPGENGETEESTLGITLSSMGCYFNQMYKKYNAQVHPNHREAADKLIENLNKLMREGRLPTRNLSPQPARLELENVWL